MIFVKNTPNSAGAVIYGDYRDFDGLYEALHSITGDEYEFPAYGMARLRILGICYDLRHAMMGDREIEFVDNGMHYDKKRNMGVVCPDKNVYYKINVLWPEILFVTMAINDFIRLYAKKKCRNCYDFLLDKRNIWDPSIAAARLFQTEITKCIKETVPEKSFSRVINLMYHEYPWMSDYTTQYLDFLNLKFIEMDGEKRLKSIPTMAKRLVEQGEEYQQVTQEVIDAAREYGCSVDDIRYKGEYPEEIDW